MRFTIENSELQVQFLRKGAELCSVQCKDTGREYIWQAEEAWPRHAPNLFPIVGSLIDHEYRYQARTYHLKHHGFARDMDFDVLQQSEHSIAFILAETEATLESYPFKFRLIITYTLEGRRLTQKFRVINEEDVQMPVSFGAHPAFNAKPISKHYLKFNGSDTHANLMDPPLISQDKRKVIDEGVFNLNESVFNDDALIFIQPDSSEISLCNDRDQEVLKVEIEGWPYLGIWAKPGAPYVCIEPWEGLADLVGHNKEIAAKEGIIFLRGKGQYQNSFTMTFNRL